MKMMDNLVTLADHYVDSLSHCLYRHEEGWVKRSPRKTAQKWVGFSLLAVFVLPAVCKLQSRTRMEACVVVMT